MAQHVDDYAWSSHHVYLGVASAAIWTPIILQSNPAIQTGQMVGVDRAITRAHCVDAFTDAGGHEKCAFPWNSGALYSLTEK
jgi:hypothetical protein